MADDTAQLVEALLARLEQAYVFPEKAKRAGEILRRRLTDGAYPSSISSDLCEQISRDLLEACDDKHLRLLWHESERESAEETDLVAAIRAQILFENYGLQRVERLPGNVGLIALTIIPEASTGTPVLAAAMQLVANTRCLIIDLRGTRGGSPDGVAYLASFFFPDGETHLSDFIQGADKKPRQFWTYPYLSGPRFLDRRIFVLTGAATFSGGEALAYDLQAHGRARVVGAVTRGGAHPSQVVSLTQHVELRLPVARPVNPITGGNWEGVGVRPDVEVPEQEAFDAAYRLALEAVVNDPAAVELEILEARATLERMT